MEQRNVLVRWTQRLEDAEVLDRPVRAVQPTVTTLFGSGVRGAFLRGDWLGHALHPLLTDVVLGSWTSAALLDAVGGRDSQVAAQRLVGIGLLAVAPTAWSGWAEWSAAGPRDKRVGLVHAATNGLAIGSFAASYVARRRDRHRAGRSFALVGMTAAGAAAYLGGHLSAARKVGSHHPAFE